MPSPQFLTPDPVSTRKSHRRFTLDQANKTLPLVRRIVADIVAAHSDITLAQGQLDTTASSDQPAIQRRLTQSLERLQDYVDELSEVGCELKDFRIGLIDFIGRHDGRDVCLCWKLGEEKILFWHELKAGFAGRQPITTIRER